MVATRLFTDSLSPRLKSLMPAAESGPFRGLGTSTYVPLFACPVPASAITPASTLRFGSHVNKYPSAAGGHNLKVTVAQGANEVIITQAFINASLLFFNWDAKLTFSADRKFGYMDSVNVLNSASGSIAAGTFPSFVAKTSGSANISARTRGPIAFVTYSSAPTVETKLIDFDQPCEIRFYVAGVSGDTIEMKSAFVELLSGPMPFVDYCSPKATLFFGHSFPEGTGSTAGNDMCSLLRAARPGRPLETLGLGGQKYAAGGGLSLIDRILADPRAMTRDLIICGPENDASADGPVWANTVLTRLAQVMAIRKAGTKTIILNSVTATTWSAGLVAAAQYVNAQLAASSWGSMVADIYTAHCTEPGGYPDPAKVTSPTDFHPNDAGHLGYKNVIDAKMTANGWA